MQQSQSKCAKNMAQRLAALKKDQEIDRLRVYLIKYNLFPRNRDPQTSPIRVEELKELVKHWKLHRRRGFWRDHPEKDDLVRALLTYIKTEADNKKRRQVGQHLERKYRGLTFDQDAHDKYRGKTTHDRGMDEGHPVVRTSHHLTNSQIVPINATENAAAQIFDSKADAGDLFYQRGTYDDGMIYLSRMEKPKMSNERSRTNNALRQSQREEGVTGNDRGESLSFESTGVETTRDLKLKCAESIYNISYHERNEVQMLKEGVMHTLLGLIKTDDRQLRLYVSASLINLATNPDAAGMMLEEGALQATLELAHTNDVETMHNCALILAQFSCDEQFHFRMVQEGCALTLMQMMGSPDDRIKEVCMKALINLAALPQSTMSDSIMSTLIHLAKVGEKSTRLVCANGLLNLSIMATTRVSVVEDGAILALRVLSTDTDDKIQETISQIMCNLAAVRANQELMVKNGALVVLNDLLSFSNETIRHQSAAALAYLCCNTGLQTRIVGAGLIEQLVSLLNDKNTETKRQAALSLSNLSLSYNSRTRMVQDNVVEPLIRTMLNAKDILIKKDCVIALCNLMQHPQTYKDMVDQGVVPAFMSLSDSEDSNIQNACAMSLVNLSYDELMQVKIVEQGVLPPLINMAALPIPDLQKMCITTLYNLSQRYENAQSLLYEGTVGVIVMILNDAADDSNIMTETQRQQCCAILCNLSNYEKGRESMLDAGAVDAIVRISRQLNKVSVSKLAKRQGISENDMVNCLNSTRAFAAGTLCNLSSMAMSIDSYFPTLMELANSHDPETTLRCSMALSNISCTPTGRKLMASDEDLAGALIAMMRTGRHETQVNAAIALCNIARQRGPREMLWKKGTVADFIVVALLRINSDDTKEICAKVLFNLLSHEDTRDDMLADGVMYALIKLAKLERTSVRELCIRAMYNISLDESRIQNLIDGEITRVLASMYQQDYTKEMKRLMCGIMSNLSSIEGNEVQLIHEGSLGTIKLLVKLRDPETRAYCASFLCNLSCRGDVTSMMVRDGVFPVLVTLSRSENKDIRRCSAGAICNMSANRVCRQNMTQEDAVSAIVDLMVKGSCRTTLLLCMRALSNLCRIEQNLKKLVEGNAVPVLTDVLAVNEDHETLVLCAKLLYQLTTLPGVECQIARDGIVRALVTIAHSSSKKRFCSSNDLILALRNLSSCQGCHGQMINDGAVEAIVLLAGHAPKTSGSTGTRVSTVPITYNMDENFSFHCAIALRNLSTSCDDGNRAKIASQPGAIRTLMALAQCPNAETRENTAVALYNISCYRRSRSQIIALDGVKTLIRLGNTSNTWIKHICSLSLHSLSTHDANIMQGGLIQSVSSLADLHGNAIKEAAANALEILGKENVSIEKDALDDGLSGVERPTKQPGAAALWSVSEMDAPNMPAFSIDETHQLSEESSTMPRQCTLDTCIGELKYLEGESSKYKLLTHESVDVVKHHESVDVLPKVTSIVSPEIDEQVIRSSSSATSIRMEAAKPLVNNPVTKSRSPRCLEPIN